MEQRFTYQGEQYNRQPQDMMEKPYILNSSIPAGENKWSEQIQTDTTYGFPADEGLDAFHHFYASNTCIPGPYRPRPAKTMSPLFNANGVNQLFHSTRELQYTTLDGRPPPAPVPFAGERLFDQYNVIGSKAGGVGGRTERCGCAGGGPVLPGF